MPKPATAVQHKREFFCLTCTIAKPFGFPDLVLHLEAFHGITDLHPDGSLKGRRSGIATLDLRDMYSNSWEWELENRVRVLETCSGPMPHRFSVDKPNGR